VFREDLIGNRSVHSILVPILKSALAVKKSPPWLTSRVLVYSAARSAPRRAFLGFTVQGRFTEYRRNRLWSFDAEAWCITLPSIMPGWRAGTRYPLVRHTSLAAFQQPYLMTGGRVDFQNETLEHGRSRAHWFCEEYSEENFPLTRSVAPCAQSGHENMGGTQLRRNSEKARPWCAGYCHRGAVLIHSG